MGKLKFVGLGLIVSFIWIMIASSILNSLGYADIPRQSGSYEPFWYGAFFSCIWAPLWEEALYRHLPITAAKHFKANAKTLAAVMIGSSAIFGWGHGECQEGVFVQGVLGFIFSWVYLKTENIKYSILLHSVYNTILTFLPIIFPSLTFHSQINTLSL